MNQYHLAAGDSAPLRYAPTAAGSRHPCRFVEGDVVVVPDSGKHALTGITGQFRIEIISGTHQYEFSYQLSLDV